MPRVGLSPPASAKPRRALAQSDPLTYRGPASGAQGQRSCALHVGEPVARSGAPGSILRQPVANGVPFRLRRDKRMELRAQAGRFVQCPDPQMQHPPLRLFGIEAGSTVSAKSRQLDRPVRHDVLLFSGRGKGYDGVPKHHLQLSPKQVLHHRCAKCVQDN